jgi:hypothetical protein
MYQEHCLTPSIFSVSSGSLLHVCDAVERVLHYCMLNADI